MASVLPHMAGVQGHQRGSGRVRQGAQTSLRLAAGARHIRQGARAILGRGGVCHIREARKQISYTPTLMDHRRTLSHSAGLHQGAPPHGSLMEP
eukprot:7007656-Prymnesium_polylepis.1